MATDLEQEETSIQKTKCLCFLKYVQYAIVHICILMSMPTLATSFSTAHHFILPQSKPTLTKAGLAVGAVGAAAVVLFNEVEIVLEVLGVAAAGNFLARKLLFAKDREQTVDQIRCKSICGGSRS